MSQHRLRLLFRSTFIALFVILFLSMSCPVLGITVEEDAYKINLSGKKTWTVKFGFGDGGSLSGVGYPKDSYSLSQSLKAKLNGRLGEAFSLGANLDDSKPGYLQEFGLEMDTDNWDGRLGNLVSEEGENFTVYNKKLLGLRLNGNLEETGVELIAGRLQGISKTKVFYGDRAVSTVEFSLYKSGTELEKRGYKENIRGLQYFGLDIEYVEGFTDPEMGLNGDEELWNFLREWEIGYLQEEIEKKPTKELSSGQYEVVSRDRDYLVLLQDRTSLARSWIREYISKFNEGLPEKKRKEYPFNPETDYEKKFFRGLEKYIDLTVGKENLHLSEYRQERFYFLGVTGIKRENFQLEVKRDENWEPVGDLPSYSYTLFPEKGIVDLDFPGEFFENLKDKGIKATFQYEISGKVYMLGFSVTPGSEKVYLNGELLKRDTDYSIDYETGALLIFKELGPDDKIRVDFERARGGFGGYAEYGRNLYGFSTRMESDYGLVMDVSLFQARDSAPEKIPPEASTMPNVHTVAGIATKYQENGWDVGLKFAGNVNRFPFDDNKRINLPNEINEIISLSDQGYDMTLFLHNNGFTARESDDWESYGPGDGLAGNRVNAGVVVESHLYLGTDTGLTAVNLEGVAPFGRSANWNSYYEADGLPKGKILSLASDGKTLWAGTSSGVVQVEVGSLDENDPWIDTTSAYFDDIPVSSIASIDDRLWLGTEKGLYLFDLSRGELTKKSPYVEEKVLDLETKDGDLFVATEEGLVRIGRDLSQEQLVEGDSVYGLSVGAGEVWFGTGRGFSKVGSAVRYGKDMITAVQATDSAVWAGSEGEVSGDARELVVYRLADSLAKYATDETKIEGLDENRYRNIDPNLHTDRGIFFSGKVGKEFEVQSRSVTLATDFKYVQPTYTPIGKTDRNDELSTGVSLDVGITKSLSIGLGSDYSISSLSTGSGAWAMTNRISAYWETLINLTGEFTWKIGEKKKDQLGLTLGMDKTFWEDTLTVAANLSAHREIYSDSITTDYASISTKLSFSPLSSVTVGLNYTYPLSIGPFERRKEEKLTWNFDFTREISLSPDYGAGLQFTGEGSMFNPLLEGVESFDSQAKVQLEPDELGVIGFDLSPVFSLSWKTDGSSHELTGKVTGKGSMDDLSTRTTLSRTVRFTTRTSRVKYKDKFQGRVSYAFDDLTPRLSYSLNRDLLTHPDFGRKATYGGNLSLGVEWQLYPNLSNKVDLGVEYQSEKGLSYIFDDSLAWEITSDLVPEFSLGLDYFPGSGELDSSTELEVSYPFQNRWGISFLSGVNWGLDEDGEVYNSYYGSVGLGVEF